MTDPSSLYTDFEQEVNTNGPDTVLLTALHYQYQQYKANAYTNGDVTVTNDRIYDVSGRNPYESRTAFAVAPFKNHLEGNTFTFQLQEDMCYTNLNKTLLEIAIDFGNGEGYQILNGNGIKNVTYNSGGEKIIKVRFTYGDNTVVNSHSKLYVEYAPPLVLPLYAGNNIDTETITATKAYQGTAGIGDITIEYAGNDQVLDKPLIVVEGFDPDDDFDYNDPTDENDPGGLLINLGNGQTLNDAIENEGYDLVFVNFRNSTDYIQRNAYMVESVIEWVNDHKTGSGQNVVLGMSMGGLVARYALRDMEVNGLTHETKLYISHDAPHQGANVPLAYQGLVRHLVGESIGIPLFLGLFELDVVSIEKIVPDLEDALELLESPAAQQMLIYQLSGQGNNISINNNSLHASFSQEYQNLGYPVQDGIRNIAISNGSECGTPLDFAPYAQLAHVDKTIDLPFFATNILFTVINVWTVNPLKALTSFLSSNTDIKAQFNLRALPDQQSKRIYNGEIYIKKKVLGLINVEESMIDGKSIYSSNTLLPLDNAGGGIYDINQFATLPSDVSEFILEQRFNFIPTFSSLDIGGGNQAIYGSDLLRVYSPLAPPSSLKEVSFDNFFTNPTISENHMQFTLNNGQWLLTELQGSPAFYSCASSCSAPPQTSITGNFPPGSCNNSTSTFSVSNPGSWCNLRLVREQWTSDHRIKYRSFGKY